MYNLLVGFVGDDDVEEVRVGEYTDEALVSYFKPGGQLDPSRVASLPTLIMPESQQDPSGKVARVGHLEQVERVEGRKTLVRFRFVPNPAFPSIPLDRVLQTATELGVDSRWEFNRTHWALKDVDLYRVLGASIVDVIPTPRVFRLPVEENRKEDLVAVMMPFSADFDEAYAALSSAAASVGMRCQRADDIWEDDAIMNDVVSLIWRSRVVIADFSNTNANVFYEAGIAHTLGRDVIQIAQSATDIPFDLQGLRALIYQPDSSGLATLEAKVSQRLRAVVGVGTLEDSP